MIGNKQSPEDMMDEGYKMIKNNVKNELEEKIKTITPSFFEELVVELIRKMGYGISHNVTGQPGDGGIDGIIEEDKLGFDKIYIQAKRWERTVSEPELRSFVGALQSKQSKKGIFITSSNFSDSARDYIKQSGSNILLIDGKKLIEYMYEYDLGLKSKGSYQIKEIDEKYFA